MCVFHPTMICPEPQAPHQSTQTLRGEEFPSQSQAGAGERVEQVLPTEEPWRWRPSLSVEVPVLSALRR